MPEPCPHLPTEGQAVGAQALRKPQGLASPWRRHGEQAFRAQLAGACGLVTKKRPHAEVQADGVRPPWEISQSPRIPAVYPGGGRLAQVAADTGAGGGHLKGELRGRLIEVPPLQGHGHPIRDEVGQESQDRGENESGFLLGQGHTTGHMGYVPRRPTVRVLRVCWKYSI